MTPVVSHAHYFNAAAQIGSRTSVTTNAQNQHISTFEFLVPPGHWQSARPATDEAVLVGCVVAPGFDAADFTMLDAAVADGGR